MGNDIQLDGTEISIVKAIGIGGGEVDGTTLIERCADLELPEIMDALHSLMDLGYVEGDSDVFYNSEELADICFRVNSGYAKDLKDALDDRPEPKKSKRVRRE